MVFLGSRKRQSGRFASLTPPFHFHLCALERKMLWHKHLPIVSVWLGCHLLPQPRGALRAAAREPHGDLAPVPGLLADRPGRGEWVRERQASGSIQPQALFICLLRPPVVLGGG